jgi:hypothetical protein
MRKIVSPCRVAALLIALVLAGCGPAPSPDTASVRTLVGAEIRDILLADTLYRSGWRGIGQWQYASRHSANGTMQGRLWFSGGQEQAGGTWEISGDLYCRTWSNNWGGGEPGCFRVSMGSGDTLVFEHASGSRGDADRYVYLRQAGNPYNL